MSRNYKVGVFALIMLMNIVLVFFYTFSSWYFWDRLSSFQLTHSVWSPLSVLIVPAFLNNGGLTYMPDCYPMANYPFILFCVAIIANLICMAWLVYKKA